MSNIFGDSHIDIATDNSLGPRLSNIRDKTLSSESIFSVLPSNNAVDGIPISVYGKTLLNTTSLNTLRTALLSDNEEAIAYNGGDNLEEINFHTYASGQTAGASNLRLKITTAETIVNNPLKLNDNLFVDTIKRKSDNTDALSLGTTTMTLQKAMTIFRDSTDKGYVRVQNSVNNKTGYIDFMTGQNDRVAYLGQGEENDLLKTGNFLYLGMENQCGFSINDGVVSIFNVNLENDSINLNYTTNANNNFIMKNDNAHKEINNNNNLPLLKVPTGQLYSANLYGKDANNGLILSSTPLHYKLDAKVAGADKDVYIPKSQCDTLTANTSITTPVVISQVFRSKQGDSEILLQNNGATHNIRIIPGATNFIQSTSNTLSFTKLNNSVEQIKIDHINSGTSNTGSLETNYDVRINIEPTNLNYCLYRAPDGEQVSLYTHSGEDSGGFLCQRTTNGLHIKLNSYHTNGHRNLCLNTSNIGKLIVGSEVEYTDSEKFIINSTTLYKNGLNTDSDINLNTTSKLHFSSNNYLANDASHNLNLYINNNKNFVADTGNDQSSYEYKIDGNSVMKMTRDLTTNPALPDNKTQISSQKLSVKDNNISGGYIELERTGATGTLAGYINYYNSSGRLFYTGFNDGAKGNPVHYFEDQCLSYIYKNSLGPIMKIVSYESGGTYNSTSNYVEISNKLFCNDFSMYNSNYVDGSTPNNDDGKNEINGRNFNTSDTGHLRLSSGGGTAPATSKTLIDIYGSSTEANRLIRFKVGDQPMLKITNNEIRCGNAIVPDGGILNVGKINNRWGNVYTTNLNSNTGLFNTNLQTPSLISSTNTSSNQCRLDLDDLLGTFVFRDGTGTEKSILIGSYNALVANVQITANQGILMNNTLNSRDVIPTGDGQYDLGSSSQHFKDIYATNNVIDTSDRNKKKDIQPIVNALETIMKLKPVSYKFKDGKSGRTHTGFIAQDCKDTYIKDWAGYVETDGKHYGLRYAQFISLNTQAIKELYGLIQGKEGTPLKTPSSNYQQGGEHKCAGVYNLENDIEELVKDKEQLTIDLFALKTQNQILEERVIQLENIDYHQQPVEPVDVSALKHRVEILEEETLMMSENSNTTHIDILNSRLQLIENENKKMKLKLQKQTTLINKMLKAMDMV